MVTPVPTGAPKTGYMIETMAPDLTVGCIEYEDDVVALVTCSRVAPKDKSLTIIGDNGVLTVADVRNDRCPVYVRSSKPKRWRGAIERRLNSWRRTLQLPGHDREWLFWKRYPLVNAPVMKLVSKGKPVDFCRGPAELAAAVREQRACRLSGQLGVHVTELVETLQYPETFGNRRQLTSRFDRIDPLWQ